MTPSIDIRLASTIRAMTDVIIPALDADNSLANEQAQLVVNHLKMIAAQWNKVEPYSRVCVDDLIETLGNLNPSGGGKTVTAAGSLRNAIESVARTNSFETAYAHVNSALAQLVRAVEYDGEVAFRHRLHKAIRGFSKRQARRDFSWFAMSGYYADSGEKLSIDELTRSAHRYETKRPLAQ